MRAAVTAGSLAAAGWSLPALAPLVPALAARMGVPRTGAPPGAVAITFDDGPHREGTPRVLELLAGAGVRATFFLVGEQVERHRALAAEIAAAGHAIALHGHRHRVLLRVPPAAVRDDLARGTEVIEAATGVRPVLHRGVRQRAERALAKQFDLPFLPRRILRRFRRQGARGVGRLNRAGELRVARREVVVPEEGHLLLERAVRVDHAEQPPLPGVVDRRIGRERAVRRHPDVARLPDLRIHIVGDELVVDDSIDRGAVGQVAEERQVVGARAKPRASQQMFDPLISHCRAP